MFPLFGDFMGSGLAVSYDSYSTITCMSSMLSRYADYYKF